MSFIISSVSALIAGMGIGGGAFFVILSTKFLNMDQKYAQALNLIMFVAVSIASTYSNFKAKKIDFKLFKKTIFFLLFGSIIGTHLVTKLSSESLKTYFKYFLVCIGIYEIITSLIRIRKAKNNTMRKE